MKTQLTLIFTFSAIFAFCQEEKQQEYFVTTLGRPVFCDLRFSCNDTLYFELNEKLYKTALIDVSSTTVKVNDIENCGNFEDMMSEHMVTGKTAGGLWSAGVFMSFIGAGVAVLVPVAGIVISGVGLITYIVGIGRYNKAFDIGRDYYSMKNAEIFVVQ
jgi:hypothetical protein